MNTTYMVCDKCHRQSEHPAFTRGWLIDTHKDPEKAVNGEMVIRGPEHVTKYAISQAERGRQAIRR